MDKWQWSLLCLFWQLHCSSTCTFASSTIQFWRACHMQSALSLLLCSGSPVMSHSSEDTECTRVQSLLLVFRSATLSSVNMSFCRRTFCLCNSQCQCLSVTHSSCHRASCCSFFYPTSSISLSWCACEYSSTAVFSHSDNPHLKLVQSTDRESTTTFTWLSQHQL